MRVRPERPGDEAAIFEVNARAFETDAEARIADAVRAAGAALVSLVAEDDDAQIVGHILFSPVTVAGRTYCGLAPMAVVPEKQGSGIGSALVEAGIDACRARGERAIFVLGHEQYYPRFGFEPAGPRGLHFVSEEYDPHFFVLELEPDALRGVTGLVSYHPAIA